ncbi:hypothetical protein G7054_g14678 [Neopestalotiopsis clavispora]|nr:hypothetical protein G7054_g14678 [Neopestalotiopsis clavispora]
MEAIAALGLAANIVQFTEYAVKLVFETREVYASGRGTTEEVQTLAAISENLKSLASNIDTRGARSLGLQNLISQCQNIAKQLLSAIDSLQVRGDKTAWKSFVVALRAVRRQGDIEKLRRQIGELQNSLLLQLQSIIFDRQSKLLQAFSSLQERTDNVDLNRRQELLDIKNSLRLAVEEIKNDARLHRGNVQSYNKKLRKAQEVTLEDVEEFSKRLNRIRAAADDAVRDADRISQEQRCLQSLRFEEIQRRYKTVESAHKDTFDWVFRDSVPLDDGNNLCIGFREWLQSRDGYFWFEGKPGSGKSTLMKYICKNKKTLELLQTWADKANKRLITAKHFFWHSGTPLQKSQEGLLRSLLFEILRACPDLIHQIGQRQYSDSQDLESWSREELFGIFERLATCDLEVRFCFFVDGLDEYNGNKEDLVELLQSLLRIPDLKICLSSRPIPRFRDAFGMDSTATLRLQDLTRNDIRTYVKDRFLGNETFRKIATRDSRYTELIESVVDLANGVFLWVHLVVNSLLEGASNRDHLSDLQFRLKELPPTLEAFFQHMIDNIDEVYKRRAVEAFRIALTCPEPSLLSTYTVLDQLREAHSQVVDGVPEIMTARQLAKAAGDTENRLYARCQGLLNVSRTHSSKGPEIGGDRVDFLHRSVRDFLNTRDMQEMLQSYSHESFNPNLELCRAMVATMRTVQQDESAWTVDKHSYENSWADLELIQPLFYFVREIEIHQPGSQDMIDSHQILDDTDLILREAKWKWRNKRLAFVGHAAEHGLAEYVKLRLEAKPDMALRHKERPLLDYALRPQQMRFIDTSLRSLTIISLLLKKEANPNEKYTDWTVWARFLQASQSDDGLVSAKFFDRSDIYEIILQLVKNGADLDAVVKRTLIERTLSGRAADLNKPKYTYRIDARADDWLQSYLSPERYNMLLEAQPAEKRKCHLM